MIFFLNKIFKRKLFWLGCFLLIPFVVFATGQFPSSLSDSVQVDVSVTCPNESCTFAVPGCTNNTATNYNALATFDDGSCTYPPPIIIVVPIPGCTDPLATNYNRSATLDNGTCTYNVPNVSNFTAVKSGTGVRLTWTKPSFAQLSEIIVVKSASSIPSSPNSGDVIYNGTGQAVTDTAIDPGVTYYYVAFVRSQGGAYSSGALTSYKETPPSEILGCTDPRATNFNPTANKNDGSCIFPPEVEEILGCTDPRATNFNPTANKNDSSCNFPFNEEGENGDGGGNDGGDKRAPGGTIGSGPNLPFDNLPVVSLDPNNAEKIKPIELFVFKQIGEKSKPFLENGYVKLKGNKSLTISVDYYKMPEVLKTIGVTLYNLKDQTQSFSFLMKLNNTKTAYEATIESMPEDGEYGISIYLINYEDQTVKKYTGQLAIVGSLGILGVGTEKFVKQVAGPVAVTGGVTAGIFQLLFASGNVASFSDVYLLFLRQMGAILGLLGLKKKNKPWGTVYDSVTKRPIDPAYVTVITNQEEVATAITDIDGRYGFSLLDGDYSLKANKTHYQFPSSRLRGQTHDEMYENLYFGESFHVLAGEVINKSIPLDPVGFDWNEFVKGQGNYFKLHTAKEVLRSRIIGWIYRGGFIMSVFYLVFYPSILNILIPVLYILIDISSRYWKKRHKVVTIKNQAGEPASFAIVRIYYAELDQEIKKVVADMVGRFYLLVRPGIYYLTIDHKQPDGTYARIYKSPVTELKKGVWEKDIKI